MTGASWAPPGARSTDVRIRAIRIDFRDVEFLHPLQLAAGAIDRFTYVLARATVEGRQGREAEGLGAGILSIPWAWPHSTMTWAERDTALRRLVVQLGVSAVGLGPSDPLTLHDELLTHVPAELDRLKRGGLLPDPVPALAAALVIGPIDNALHDAWARCANRPAFAMYRREAIREEVRFGPGVPRTHLPVQHVVGVAEPLTSRERSSDARSLEDWVRLEGISHVKVKVNGRDPHFDADRVAAVYQVMLSTAGRVGSISIDPNEGYRDAEGVAAMVASLREHAPAAFDKLRYVEQPIPRDAAPDAGRMREIGRLVPIVADEGVAGIGEFPLLLDQGWSGLAIKAAKGQTLALRTYAFARAHGLFATIQDLTAVDHALFHSARLASHLRLSSPTFEYNSRQYAPQANRELAAAQPALVAVEHGRISVPRPTTDGLY